MLYEPTNIVPSTLTNTGTIDVNDVVSFSWQINGNSAMTGFKIEMFQNNSISTTVGTALEVTGLTVYGRDTLGNIVQYTYTSPTNQTWAQVFSGMENGNKYKFKITQYYSGRSVEQTSFSAINAFAKPEVTNLAVSDLTDNVLARSIINATATYTQAQGNNIQSVRWQLYENGTLIDDTGSIQTANLGYEYGGATSGNSYNLMCLVVSEAGQTAQANKTFTVFYQTDNYPNNFAVQCLCGADGNLLEWELLGSTSIIIEGVANPTSGYSISNNQLALSNDATVTWDTVQNGANPAVSMNFSSPWVAVFKTEIKSETISSSQKITVHDYTQTNTQVHTPCISFKGSNSSSFSICYKNYDKIKFYGLENNQYVLKDSYGDNIANDSFNAVTYNATGSLALACGDGNATLYTVAATHTPVQTLVGRSTNTGVKVNTVCAQFNPDGNLLVLALNSQINIYSISNNSAQYLNSFNNHYATDIQFNSEGGYLAIATSTEGVLYYEVNGNIITYKGAINQLYLPYITCIRWGVGDNNNRLYILSGAMFYVYEANVVGGTLVWVEQSATEIERAPSSFDVQGNRVVFTIDVAGSGYGYYYYLDNNIPHYVTQFSIYNSRFGSSYGGSRACYVPISPSSLIIGSYYQDPILSDTNLDFEKITIVPPPSYSSNISTLFVQYAYPNIIIKNNNVAIGSQIINFSATKICVGITPSSLIINYFDNNGYVETKVTIITYNQPTVTSVVLTGPQTCTYFALADGDGSAFIDDLSNPDFQFSWGSPNYTLNMYANFVNGLNAGTGGGRGFMIYRQEVEILDKSTNADGEIEYTTNALTPQKELVRLASTVSTIKDYGLKSKVAYQYAFYAYNADNAFYGSKTAVVPARQFQRYSLLATKFSQEDDCYHVYKEFQFSCNIADPTVSNNNNPQFMQNFTPYPTRINSSANYASGTLQSLIGFVDKETYNYFDSAALMDELNSLSTADYTLFLKDMKGHIRMVATSAPIQQTTTLKTRQMQVTISIPWTEIDNANEVSIIQLPTDDGWNNDVQILDVRLKVDFDTGELIVTYPYPYYGITFNYSKNSGTLNTSTPYGVAPASVTLDTTAGSTTSGAVIASVDDKEST